MSVQERIRLCSLIEEMKQHPEMSETLGLVDKTDIGFLHDTILKEKRLKNEKNEK